MDPVSGALAGEVAKRMTGWSSGWIGRQIGYVVSCNKSIKKLKEEVEPLRALIKTVEAKVEMANKNAENIYEDVLNWLSRAQKMENEVTAFVEKESSEVKCCNGWCPDLTWRHQVGKNAQTKLTDVANMKREEGCRRDPVGYPAPDSLVRWLSDENCLPFESRDSVLSRIMEALNDDSSYIVGIYGMAGVGKTTTVEKAAKLAHQQLLFHEFTRAVISQNPNFRTIQAQLAHWLNLEFNAANSTVDQRASKLRKRLENGKKILIIIDDVWDEIDLKKIGIPFTENTKGCKILLTSRSSDVCRKMGVPERRLFPIGLLSEQEAWRMFREKVGCCMESPAILPSAATHVCKECGRLPLAIVTIGAALKGKQEQVWNDMLEKLSTCKVNSNDPGMKEIHFRLKLSFEYSLRDEELRSCFYYCCLFPEDAEISIDDLVKYGLGTRFLQAEGTHKIEKARNRIHRLVGSLVESCLLLQGSEKDFVKMHDVVRDVAISIASKAYGFLVQRGVEEWPEEDKFQHCRVISLQLSKDLELPQELKCPELHTLAFKTSSLNLSISVPNGFFNGMPKLEVLELRRMHLAASTTLGNSVNLRVLCIEFCEVEAMSFLEKLTKLEILSFRYSDVEEVSPVVGQLTSLRMLDLRMNRLKVLPQCVISSLTRLEELYISNTFGGWGSEGNASIGELNSLTHLMSLELHVPRELLPLHKELGFQKLKRFDISTGRRILVSYYYLGERSLKINGERRLEIKGICMDDDEVSGLMERSEVLHLEDVKDSKEVLGRREGRGLLDLKFLEARNGPDEMLKHLLVLGKWNCFGKLSVLKIYRCGLEYLLSPSTARALAQLQLLTVDYCGAMEALIVGGDDHGKKQNQQYNNITFPSLKMMYLKSLPKFRTIYAAKADTPTAHHHCPLFSQKVSFPALQNLSIGDLKNITTIWDNRSQAVSVPIEVEESPLELCKLVVKKCDELVNVAPFNFIKRLQNLAQLEIVSCSLMTSLVEAQGGAADDDEIVVFPRLEVMNLEHLGRFKGFFNNREFNGGGEEKIPMPLFNNKVLFPALWDLSISGLENITTLWDNHSQSTLVPIEIERSPLQLCKLVVKNCRKLVNVFPFSMLRVLRNLLELQIVMCSSMISLVELHGRTRDEDEIVVFPHLKSMYLDDLQSFKSFWYNSEESNEGEEKIPLALFNSKVKLSSLEYLNVSRINNLKEMWQNAIWTDSFCNLKELHVTFCGELLSVAPSKLLQSFRNLKTLVIHNCGSLKEVFEDEASEETKEIIFLKADKNPIFPQLQWLNFRSLPKLMHLHQKICISGLRASNILWIDCANFEKVFAMDSIDERTSEMKS